MMEKTDVTLGFVFKILREDVLGLSLAEAGDLFNCSCTTYFRFEKDDFGKKFIKRKNSLLKAMSNKIANALLNGYAQPNCSQNAKNILLKTYKYSMYYKNNIYTVLENIDCNNYQNLSEFIYTMFTIFSGDSISISTFNNKLIKKESFRELDCCIRKIIQIYQPKEILYVHFNTNLETLMSLAKDNEELTIIAIDKRKNVIEEAKGKALENEITNINFIEIDILGYLSQIQELPEFILFFHSFHHICDPLDNKIEILKRIKEKMLSTGKMLICEAFMCECTNYATNIVERRNWWNTRIQDVYFNSFWESLKGSSKEDIEFSKSFAQSSLQNEIKIGNNVLERNGEYLISMSWLMNTASILGYETKIAEYCNVLGDGVVLLSNEK